MLRRPGAAPFDAVILAGGRSARMGADKPALVVGGSTLLGSVIAAARAAGAAQVIVVGPPARDELPGGEPSGSEPGGRGRRDLPGPGGSAAAGQLPALRRGLAEVTAPVVALLAADLPFLQAAHLRALRGALRGTAAPPAAAVPPDVAAGAAGRRGRGAAGRCAGPSGWPAAGMPVAAPDGGQLPG